MIEKIQPGKTLTVGGVAGSGYAHLAVDHILKSGGSLLFLAKSDEEANSAFHDFSFYSKINLPQSRVILFPELSVNAYSRISPNPEVIAQRLKLYHQLTQSRHPNIVIASIESFVRKIIPKNSFTQKSFQLSKGDVLDRDEFIKKLTGLGYQRVPLVEDFGNFSVRGGIVDFYSPSCENPTRVEFLGDSV